MISDEQLEEIEARALKPKGKVSDLEGKEGYELIAPFILKLKEELDQTVQLCQSLREERKERIALTKELAAERKWSADLEGALKDIQDFEGGLIQPEASKSCAMRGMAREALAKKKEILGSE